MGKWRGYEDEDVRVEEWTERSWKGRRARHQESGPRYVLGPVVSPHSCYSRPSWLRAPNSPHFSNISPCPVLSIDRTFASSHVPRYFSEEEPAKIKLNYTYGADAIIYSVVHKLGIMWTNFRFFFKARECDFIINNYHFFRSFTYVKQNWFTILQFVLN